MELFYVTIMAHLIAYFLLNCSYHYLEAPICCNGMWEASKNVEESCVSDDDDYLALFPAPSTKGRDSMERERSDLELLITWSDDWEKKEIPCFHASSMVNVVSNVLDWVLQIWPNIHIKHKIKCKKTCFSGSLVNAILRAPIVCPGDDVDAARSDVRHGVGPRGDGTGSGGIGVVFGYQSETANAITKGIF